MSQLTYRDRVANLERSLLAVSHQKLVEMLIARVPYDVSLCKYLEAMAQATAPDVDAGTVIEIAKAAITTAYGNDDIDVDGTYYEPELYAAQAHIEKAFENGMYSAVVELVECAFQYGENIIRVYEPDNFFDLAYDSLLILWLRSQLRLGKPPAEVADFFKVLAKKCEADFDCYLRIPYLHGTDLDELKGVQDAVKKLA